MPSSLTVSSFSSFSLNNLWTFLNNLQLVTFLQFVNVPSLPWNFSLFLSYLDVSLGDVPFIKSVPNMLRLVVPMNFTLHEERAQAHFTNPYLHVSSYESRSFILNYEMRIVALFYYSFFLTLIILLARFCKDNKKCASFLRQFYSEFFFWRLFLELYVEMSFLSFYSLEDVSSLLSLAELLKCPLNPQCHFSSPHSYCSHAHSYNSHDLSSQTPKCSSLKQDRMEG